MPSFTGYASRWVALDSTDDASGSASPVTVQPPTTCVCANGEGFVPGAGGCMSIAISTESACDETNGSYTDDDATKLGTYCQCGRGRVMTDPGCVDL